MAAKTGNRLDKVSPFLSQQNTTTLAKTCKVLNKNPSPVQITAEQLLGEVYRDTSSSSPSYFYSGVKGSHYDYVTGRHMPAKGFYGAEGLVLINKEDQSQSTIRDSNPRRMIREMGLPTSFGTNKAMKKKKDLESVESTSSKSSMYSDNNQVKKFAYGGSDKPQPSIKKRATTPSNSAARNRLNGSAPTSLATWFLS